MKVLKNALWLAAGRTLADAASFLLVIVISRHFGPPGTGEYSYAFALANLVGQLSAAGYEEYGIRAYACAAESERRALWWRILRTQALQLALALIVFAVLLLSGIQGFARVTVVVELTIYYVGWCVARVLFIPCMALQQMRRPALIDLGCRLFAAGTAAALIVTTGAPLPIALLGFPLAGGALILLSWRGGQRLAHLSRPNWSTAGTASLLREVFPFAASELLYLFYARADVLLIAFWLGAAGTGLYALNVKFVEMGLIPVALLGSAVYPTLGRLAVARSPHLARAAQDFVHAGFLLTGWLAIGIAVVLPLLLVPVFGARFAPAVPLLTLFAALALAKGAETTLCRVLYSVGRQGAYVRNLGLGTVLIIALNILLIPRFGLRGAAAAAVLSTLSVALACVYSLRSYVRPHRLAGAALRTGAALALVAGANAIAQWQGLSAAPRALIAALLFPLAAFASGLVPSTRRGSLFGHTHGDLA